MFLGGKALKLLQMLFNKISKAYSLQAVFKRTEFQHKEIINLEFIFIGFWICDKGQFSCLYPLNKMNYAYFKINAKVKGNFRSIITLNSFQLNGLMFSSLEIVYSFLLSTSGEKGGREYWMSGVMEWRKLLCH